MDILKQSAVSVAASIARREISSREVCEFFLKQIQANETRVHAFTNVLNEEAVLESADQIDALVGQAEVASSLAGVPIAIKDVLCTQGVKTTCGSKMLDSFVPPYDATVVRKVKEAGLVLLGKTNMDEFAMGGSTETGFGGTTKNPWDVSRTAGGSSGGAAAAVAAGMTPLSVGTDTGGSVRQPAAYCGVCGLKPTYGRVSRFGLIAFASSLDQAGVLGLHVEDLAAQLEVIAGHDPSDSTSLNVAVKRGEFTTGLDESVKGMKVGVIRQQLEHESVSDSVRDAVKQAEQAMIDLGMQVVDVSLPHTDYAVPTYYIVAPCEASSNLARFEGVHYGFREVSEGDSGDPLSAMITDTRSQGFGVEVKRRIMLGTFALSAGYYDAYYKKALQVRRLISEDYRQAFEDVDVLLGPVAPTPAFALGERVDDPIQMYLGDLFTVGANLAGIPGLSIPAGKSVDTNPLPLAFQLQGPALAEKSLLQVGYHLQASGFYEPSLAEVS